MTESFKKIEIKPETKTGYNFHPFTHPDCVLIKDNKAVLKTVCQTPTKVRKRIKKECPGINLLPEFWLCGYVAIETEKIPGEWWVSYHSDALVYLNIHGSLNYSEVSPDASYVVFGFDCCHAMDHERPELKDPEYVMKLVESMEQQINEFINHVWEFRASDKDAKVKLIEKIRDTAPIQCKISAMAMLNIMFGDKNLD